MSQIQEETGKAEAVKEQRRGEFKMLALLFVIFAALFMESLQIEGIFQGKSSGPGGIPQIVCALMLILVAAQAVILWKQGYQEGSFSDVVQLLFDKDVVILLILVIMYGLLVETLTFIPTTIGFLIAAMYLLERVQFAKKVIIAVGTVSVLVLIFSTIFQVVLP
jgi:hypothetical protein